MKRTTVFTCSIYPDLTRVWYHFIRKYTRGNDVDVLIFDCGSRLMGKHFPGARIQKFKNVEHGKKIDDCVSNEIATPYVFLLDDDCFLVNDEAEPFGAQKLESEKQMAAFSYKPRGWWNWQISGNEYPVMGSYAVLFKPDVIRKEKLSFASRPTTDERIRGGTGYYDTGDFVNEQLLMRGYSIEVPNQDFRKSMVRSYSAVSSGFLNFARRKWFSREYRCRARSEVMEKAINSNLRNLEWSCGVAGTICLYRLIFREEPLFNNFLCYDDLHSLAGTMESSNEAKDMIVKYQDLLQTLSAHA